VLLGILGHAAEACFEGLELVEPGLVKIDTWRPAPGIIRVAYELRTYVAVGQKQ
jgi:hypothetical protein